MRKTDLDSIKKTAIAFLHLPLSPTEFGSIVIHPVYDSTFIMRDTDEGRQIVNIMTDRDALEEQNKMVEKRIREADSVNKVFSVIRVPYWLTFLKYITSYLSKEDFDKLLGDVWTESENPNGDVNVSVNTSAGYFKAADKRILMTDEEYEAYQNIPDELTVYRGVAPGRVEKGLSWTAHPDKAKWFAKRFNSEENRGYIITGQVAKKDVLAYFNRRSEDELVIHPKNVRNKTKERITL